MSIHIVIPMAGSGARFRTAGYALPKPFIEVMGTPMIKRVIDNLHCVNATYTLIARREHAVLLEPLVNASIRIVWCDAPTAGAVDTLWLARHTIADDSPLMIANSDQLIDATTQTMFDDMYTRTLDGLIVTFHEPTHNPKWSYAAVSAQGLVTATREKVAISSYATAGIYLFRKGSYFLKAAAAMMAANDRTHGEFYVCPAYNYMIRDGLKVGVHQLPTHGMHGLGTPEDLKRYIAEAENTTR